MSKVGGMGKNVTVFLDPVEFDKRVREPHRSWLWRSTTLVTTEVAFVAVAGLSGWVAYTGAGVVAVASFFIGSWLERKWRGFHTVPLEMLCEKIQTVERERNSLRKAVAPRKRNQALANELQEEWSYGLHKLVGADISTVKKYARYRFEEKEENWRKRVREIMDTHECTKQELSHVFELHEVTSKLNRFPHLPEINHAVNMVSTRLHRIRDIINDHTSKPV